MTKFCGFTPKNRFFLAPMAGITDAAFRTVCAEQGAAVTYSEMVSARALVYEDKKTASLLEMQPDHRPCGLTERQRDQFPAAEQRKLQRNS